MKKELVCPLIRVFSGIAMILFVLWGYVFSGGTAYMYELTCISNLAAGLLLIMDGVTFKWGRMGILYMVVLPCLLVVFLVTFIGTVSGLANFNWSGAFLFLHGVDPLALLVIFAFSYPLLDKKWNIISIFLAPIFVLSYLLFDLLRFYSTGELVYGLLPDEYMLPWVIIIIAIGVYGLLSFMGYGLISLREGIVSLQKKHVAKDNPPTK